MQDESVATFGAQPPRKPPCECIVNPGTRVPSTVQPIGSNKGMHTLVLQYRGAGPVQMYLEGTNFSRNSYTSQNSYTSPKGWFCFSSLSPRTVTKEQKCRYAYAYTGRYLLGTPDTYRYSVLSICYFYYNLEGKV